MKIIINKSSKNKKENVVCVYKSVGETPLDVVKRYKQKNPDLSNKKISYAGRLDPMADGLLLLLIGDENKKRDKYLKLRKEYLVEIIFGISTDSYDVLGEIRSKSDKVVSADNLKNYLKAINKQFLQAPPPYSSYRVNGKPLYFHTRNKHRVKVPFIWRQIYSSHLISFVRKTKTSLLNKILSKIKSVSGDFRQNEIEKSWSKFLKKGNQKHFQVAKVYFSVSSGTYIRSIVNSIGEDFGCHAFVMQITRIKIGDYQLV